MHAELDFSTRLFIWLVPVMSAIVLHEIAHGAVANFLGDATAKHAGRLSLNPLKHVDLIGSIAVPLVLLGFNGFIFGWAKPVPVNEARLNSPVRGMIWVAAAGPAANLLMMVFWATIMKLGTMLSLDQLAPYVQFAQHEQSVPLAMGLMLIYMGAAGIFINAAIMVLNLLPLLPLDGGRILSGLLPERFRKLLSMMEPWGLLILIIMILSGMAAKIVWPIMALVMSVITYLLNTPAEVFLDALRILLG